MVGTHLQNPHLPQGKVCLCAVSQRQTYIISELWRRGIDVLEVPPHPRLPGPIADHSDLLLHHLGAGRVVVTDSSPQLAQSLQQFGFNTTLYERGLGSKYPNDISLNCFALNGVLYCLPKHTAEELLNYYQSNIGRVQPVNQGYAKCSTCIVNAHSIITADPSIQAAAERNGLDVLGIRPGHIALPGYCYGFIGGCTGLLNQNLLAFTGDITRHPDSGSILRFCGERGVEVLSLNRGPLLDIGGILPLAIC